MVIAAPPGLTSPSSTSAAAGEEDEDGDEEPEREPAPDAIDLEEALASGTGSAASEQDLQVLRQLLEEMVSEDDDDNLFL